jgi:hypothetical protein
MAVTPPGPAFQWDGAFRYSEFRRYSLNGSAKLNFAAQLQLFS